MIIDFPYINRFSRDFIRSHLFATPLLLDNDGTYYSMAYEHASRLEVSMTSDSTVRIGTARRMVDVRSVTKWPNLVGSNDRSSSVATDLLFEFFTAFNELVSSYGLICELQDIPREYLPYGESPESLGDVHIDYTLLRNLYGLDDDVRRIIIAPEYPFRHAVPQFVSIRAIDAQSGDEIVNFVRFCIGYLPQFIDDEDCNREIARLNQLIAELRARIAELESEDPLVAELQRRIEELTSTISDLEEYARTLEEEALDKDQQIIILRREVNSLNSLIADLRAQIASLNEQLASCSDADEIDRLNRLVVELRSEIERLRQEISQLESQLEASDATAELTRLRQEISRLNAIIADLRQQLTIAHETIRSLKDGTYNNQQTNTPLALAVGAAALGAIAFSRSNKHDRHDDGTSDGTVKTIVV